MIPFTVRAGAASNVQVAEAGANLAVWERRSPMMAVEMAALMEDAEGRRPMPDACGRTRQAHAVLLQRALCGDA